MQRPKVNQSIENQRSKLTMRVPILGRIPLHPIDFIADLKIKEQPPLWAQFFKYVVCGVVATLVLSLVWLIARAFYSDYISENLPLDVQKTHSTVVLTIAFLAANVVAYTSNRIFVFTPGKHRVIVEVIIFFMVSGLSFFGGHLAKTWMIEQGYQIDLAAMSFAISSALVNFIARKYIVFRD